MSQCPSVQVYKGQTDEWMDDSFTETETETGGNTESGDSFLDPINVSVREVLVPNPEAVREVRKFHIVDMDAQAHAGRRRKRRRMRLTDINS